MLQGNQVFIQKFLYLNIESYFFKIIDQVFLPKKRSVTAAGTEISAITSDTIINSHCNFNIKRFHSFRSDGKDSSILEKR